MSFPSLRNVNTSGMTEVAARALLLSAVKTDCPEAIKYLHQKSHAAEKSEDGIVHFNEDPNSILGKQIIRIVAADAVRDVVEQEIMHGAKITFYNCCNGDIAKKGKVPPSALKQIECQNGVVASADC